jgi:hypothetical protein
MVRWTFFWTGYPGDQMTDDSLARMRPAKAGDK